MSFIKTSYVRESKTNGKDSTDIGRYSRISVLMNKISEYFQDVNSINLFRSIVNTESNVTKSTRSRRLKTKNNKTNIDNSLSNPLISSNLSGSTNSRLVPRLSSPSNLSGSTNSRLVPRLSLRVIDFFVTNYARKNEVIYDIINDKNKKEKFMVHYSYKSQLKAYSKRQFDPFCRRERIIFTVEGLEEDPVNIRTTVGQLNFFRWAIKNGVLDYIDRNMDDIETEMNKSHRKGKKKKILRNKDRVKPVKYKTHSKNNKVRSFRVNSSDRTGEKDLTLSTCKTVSKHNVVITVKFD